MKEYLLLYRNGDPSWLNRSAEEKRIVMEQWSEWFPMLESGGNLRNPGAALAPGGAVLRRNSDGIATDTTLAEVKELVGGCTLIRASSLDEATRLAGDSPFLRTIQRATSSCGPFWKWTVRGCPQDNFPVARRVTGEGLGKAYQRMGDHGRVIVAVPRRTFT